MPSSRSSATRRDARIRVEMRREFFTQWSSTARSRRLADGVPRRAGQATGVQEYLQLIERVVDKQEERANLRKARS